MALEWTQKAWGWTAMMGREEEDGLFMLLKWGPLEAFHSCIMSL